MYSRILNVDDDDDELDDSSRSMTGFCNVGIIRGLSYVSERENVFDDRTGKSFDCGLSRLSSEISLFDDEIFVDGRSKDVSSI